MFPKAHCRVFFLLWAFTSKRDFATNRWCLGEVSWVPWKWPWAALTAVPSTPGHRSSPCGVRVSSRGGITCAHGGNPRVQGETCIWLVVYITKLLGSSEPSTNTRQFIFLFKLSNFYFRVSTHLIGFPDVSVVKNPPANAGGMGSTPGLEKIPWRRKYSSILASEIPWTEEPGGLHNTGDRKESDPT